MFVNKNAFIEFPIQLSMNCRANDKNYTLFGWPRTLQH